MPIKTLRKKWKKYLLWTAAMVSMLVVFQWYQQADFLITLSNYVWSCF